MEINRRRINTFAVKNFDHKISKMTRTNPRVFTAQGISMLSTILKSKTAANVSIRIMDAFVEMKKFISNNLIKQNRK